jgi:guanylate kinase
MPDNRKIVVVSGPSGVGKTTVCERLFAEEPRVKPCITATTRAPRKGEKDGVDYYFVTKEVFKDWIKIGEIVEYTELFGNFYGTPKKSIDEILNKGFTPLLRIDVNGAKCLKELGYKGIFIFILPPDEKALMERLKKRETPGADMQERLAKAQEELNHKNEYDFRVVNDDFDKTVDEIKSILDKKLFNDLC